MMTKRTTRIILSFLLFVVLVSALYLSYSLKEARRIEKVEKAIKGIGTVTILSEPQIAEAERLYNDLKPKQKEKIQNYYVLTTARWRYNRIINVYNQIEGLDKNDISIEYKALWAKQAYDDLLPLEQYQITNLYKLEEFFCDEKGCKNTTATDFCYRHRCVFCDKKRVAGQYCKAHGYLFN